ncbi:U4/U6 small nuclear ribonucleoprotein PRP4-like protein [Triticum urartu]|uniref:Pre-mRNA processing factor 4 (PRP4)-like domain-containing protein n=1 Tax=Triticum urartu TaxID=4572 RepID=A0A8R7Q5P1_TRIUA|nr:U4/U6 small nuclear ribonucleoprotein PRP4-like protein [Triticum urartu]
MSMEIPRPLPPAITPPMAPLPIHPPIAPIPIPVTPSTSAAADDDEVDYEVSDDHRAARERHERAVQELLQRRRAYAMAVPTNDSAVRARLRRLGEPITLFGEREMERRDRLRALMVRLEADGQFDRLLRAQEDEQGAPGDDDDMEQIQYPFFTEGTNQLLQARVDIAMYSLPRAKARVDSAKRRLAGPDEDPEAEAALVVKQAGDFVLECSEIGDDRPLTGCSFSRDASMLATSSWSGIIKVWSMPQITKIATLKGHTERATDVAFSPVDNCLATASADKTAKLWNRDGSLLMSFDGHLDRLARVAFHPSGKYLGTASFDKTWRLWDINTGTELLLQEGHSRSVYGVSFHPDGSLAASCGLDANARVWDLRSGRLYCTLIGHVKPVLGVSFSPNGHLVATASEDNFCRIWDLRTRQMVYSIPAHKSLISHVKFEPQEGYYLATSSYDSKAALWSTRDYKPIKSLAGHESKVTSLDISGDGQHIVTVSHDRTIKIWSCRGTARDNEMELD